MTKHTASARTAAALRELDPATTTTLTEEERQRAEATLTLILATPGPEHGRPQTDQPRRRRRRVLVPAALLAAAAVALSTTLGGGSAFADYRAVPVTLPPPAAASAAVTCRSLLGMPDQGARVVIGERRGGWTYVLLDSPEEKGTCLMPDGLLGESSAAARRSGFFGSYDPNPPEAPTPARDSLIETESMAGAVSLPRRLSVRAVDGWFTWVTGYAGRDVARVSVDPPVGPDVEASLEDGRFAAWWPSGEARGDNPGVGGGWSYTVTLTDGTTRRV